MITIKHFTACDVPGCETLHTLDVGPYLRVHNRAPEPRLPDDWQQIGDKTYCFRHKINVTVLIDGEKIDV